MLACLLIKCCKNNDSLSLLCWASSLAICAYEHISSKYIYVWKYVCHNSSAYQSYVMWAELGHCHYFIRASSFEQFCTLRACPVPVVEYWGGISIYNLPLRSDLIVPFKGGVYHFFEKKKNFF